MVTAGLGSAEPQPAEVPSDFRTKSNPYSQPCPLDPHLPSCLHQRPGRGQLAAPPSPPVGIIVIAKHRPS